MTEREKYEIMHRAIRLLAEHVGKNGVTSRISDAMYAALRIRPGETSRSERCQFYSYVDDAATIARMYLDDYKKRNQETK